MGVSVSEVVSSGTLSCGWGLPDGKKQDSGIRTSAHVQAILVLSPIIKNSVL